MFFLGFNLWVFYGFYWDFISKYGCFMGIFNAGTNNKYKEKYDGMDYHLSK